MKAKHILLIAAALLLVLAAAAAYVLTAEYKGDETRLEIGAGASVEDVERAFKNKLGSAEGSMAALLWKLQGGTPAGSHGSYLLKPGTKIYRMARTVAKGRQTPVRLTFNNLRFVEELAARVASTIEADSAAFMHAADSIFSFLGFKATEYQAAVLPDTYEFWWTSSAESVASALAEHRMRFWNDSRRAKACSLGLTPVQVHTLASIVEEETNRGSERPTVARLYLNRLDRDMPLQSDPTLKFASGDFGARRVTGRHLKADSPYNTYRNKGLPPGPIRIVEARTLDQVLDAPRHGYIFMCAREDFSGYHNFAATLSEHNRNAARYRRALDARGIH